MPQVPTTEQIRHAIDSGVTGEKVGYPDPAAVPLGTDAEAGGNTPTRTERKMDSTVQVGVERRVPPNGVAIYLGIIAIIIVVAAVLLNSAR